MSRNYSDSSIKKIYLINTFLIIYIYICDNYDYLNRKINNTIVNYSSYYANITLYDIPL